MSVDFEADAHRTFVVFFYHGHSTIAGVNNGFGFVFIVQVNMIVLQVNRPMTMRKDGIQTRKRRPKTTKLPIISLKPDQHGQYVLFK